MSLHELPDAGKIGAAFRDYLRTVTFGPRHELRRDVRHQRDAGFCGSQYFVDVVLQAQVVAQLNQNFFAGTLGHRLVDVIAGFIHQQSIGPQYNHVVGLIGEVWLTVAGEAHQPGGICKGDDSASSREPGIRVIN